MSTRHFARKESFGAVLRKSAWFLLLLIAILAALLFFRNSMTKKNAARPALHDFTPLDAEVNSEETVAGELSLSGSSGEVLAETVPVSEEYLSDALFIGDSLTDGLFIYFPDYVNSIGIIAQSPLDVYSVLNDAPKLEDGTGISIYDAVLLQSPAPKKLYIMLGANGIVDLNSTPETLTAAYLEFCNKLKAAIPDLNIVVQSLVPVAPWLFEERPTLSGLMDDYNEHLRLMALANGFYFLDVNAAYRLDDGSYNEEIDYSGDGFHFANRDGYGLWYNYVLSHAIQGESAFSINADGMLTVSA